MKKFVLFITLIFIFCNIFCTAAFSEAASTVVVSSAAAKPGETVEIIVSLSKTVNLGCLQLSVEYDKNVMSIANVTNLSGKTENYSTSPSIESNPYKFGWIPPSGSDFSGDIFSLKFTVSETAAEGKYPVKISYFAGESNIFDANEDVVYLNYLSSFITVTDNTNETFPTEYSLCLADKNVDLGGKVVAALYNNDGQLVESKFFDAEKKVDISFSQKGDYMKLMQWNMDRLTPLTDFHRIEIKD